MSLRCLVGCRNQAECDIFLRRLEVLVGFLEGSLPAPCGHQGAPGQVLVPPGTHRGQCCACPQKIKPSALPHARQSTPLSLPPPTQQPTPLTAEEKLATVDGMKHEGSRQATQRTPRTYLPPCDGSGGDARAGCAAQVRITLGRRYVTVSPVSSVVARRALPPDGAAAPFHPQQDQPALCHPRQTRVPG